MTEYMRLESDSIGEMEVPGEAYYGVQALRANENFPITGNSLHPDFIKNMARIKRAAAITNMRAGRLKPEIANAIESACNEVVCGMFASEFIVDGIQGGAGTSANMNMNEVIANRAIEMLCGKKGDYSIVHPNDHVNMAQSTNDVIPTAGKLTVLDLLKKLEKSLKKLASGPKAGFGEITLPAMQNGSSIMPGKVNPVIPEVVSQVAFHIIGHDVTITMAAEAGQMELNAFEPVVFYNLFDSISTLTHAVDTLTDNCIIGITANEERCQKLLDASVGITTALCPYIGYKKAASLAKESLRTGVPVKKLVLKHGLMKEKQLDVVLDPYAMTEAATKKSKAKIG